MNRAMGFGVVTGGVLMGVAYPSPASAHYSRIESAAGQVQVVPTHDHILIQDWECGDGALVYAQWNKQGTSVLQGQYAPCGNLNGVETATPITQYRKCASFTSGAADTCSPWQQV